uniref:hypothetical protein n=1 Tax=Thalassospira sp. CH_XMU1420-2 TaxID=3107769 RepID=UPI003FCDFD91
LLTKADDLLFQADRLSLLDQMSDEEHSAFVAKINKGVRAVCTTIRNQHRRLQNELVRQRNSDAVKAHENELKKAGVELDAADADADTPDSETPPAKPAAKKTTKKSAKVSDEKDAEQVAENKDEAVAAE